MDIKTQTKRSTKLQEKIINLNCFVQKDFEIGIVTSKYWGDFEKREEPLVEVEIGGMEYEMTLSEFIKEIKRTGTKYRSG